VRRGAGRVHTYKATLTKSTPVTIGTHGEDVTVSITIQLKSSRVQASHFARVGTARSSRQASSIGPKRGCACSHASSRGDAFGAAQAATRRKGVVGSRGKKTPAIARPTQA
jgi:hypothetical protein